MCARGMSQPGCAVVNNTSPSAISHHIPRDTDRHRTGPNKRERSQSAMYQVRKERAAPAAARNRSC